MDKKILIGGGVVAGVLGILWYSNWKKKKDCKIFEVNKDLFVWDRPYKNADEEMKAMYAENNTSLIKEAKLIKQWFIIAKESITSDWIKGDTGGEYKIVWYELCSNTLTNLAYGKEDFFPNGSYITGKIISKDGSVQDLIKIKNG